MGLETSRKELKRRDLNPTRRPECLKLVSTVASVFNKKLRDGSPQSYKYQFFKSKKHCNDEANNNLQFTSFRTVLHLTAMLVLHV